MVILRDLFDLLATGELSNIKLSRTTTGSLAEEEYGKIVGHINLGVLELYKRFKLLEKELTLHACPGVTEYYLRPERMASLHNMNTRTYIESFENNEENINIIEVLDIFDDVGNKLHMNDRFATPTIIGASVDILKITKLPAPQVLSVVYQSYPDRIIIDDDFDAEEYEYDIPPTIIEPLLYYIAARTYKPMGANDSSVNADKSVNYQQQYELSCQKLELYGLDVQNNDNPDTFASDGWA